MTVKDALKHMPTQRLAVKHPRETEDSTSEADQEMECPSENEVGLDDDESDDGTNASGTSWRDIDCTSSKRLCHQYGYGFDVCVAKAYSLDEFDLEELAEDCWFVTKKVNEMSPSEKRNVLYWGFMVNVYHVCGKDKRRCPPKCLVKAIRERYPNPPGVPYVDFRPKNRKRRR